MEDIRRLVARVVEQHLEEILDVTMDAIVREVPAVARQTDDVRALVRASTRHTTLAFLALYADPESPARLMLTEARRATVDHAGEIFAMDEILQIIRTARQVIFQLGRQYVNAERGHVDTESERQATEALESFLTELESEENTIGKARDTVAAAVEAAGTAALEFDLVTGARGTRAPVASTLAAALTEAEDALIVNNNAAALLLTLAALAKGQEVIVSRGELIEIGGEFRLPDVMEASGALLREVGTTNRTHERDYRRAAGDGTALILKVPPSDYQNVGLPTSVGVADLAAIAKEARVPLLYDIGSGLLGPEEGLLSDEPDARSALAQGADLVSFSGDKLLGGPQAGILAGRADLIERCRRHPIARAVRADKLTLAAMEATLWAHARGARDHIPAWSMLQAP